MPTPLLMLLGLACSGTPMDTAEDDHATPSWSPEGSHASGTTSTELEVEERAGIGLTESCAMTPAASVSGLYFSHPESRYFGIGQLGRDQVVDYARRNGRDMADVERWLGPNLGYEPGALA